MLSLKDKLINQAHDFTKFLKALILKACEFYDNFDLPAVIDKIYETLSLYRFCLYNTTDHATFFGFRLLGPYPAKYSIGNCIVSAITVILSIFGQTLKSS